MATTNNFYRENGKVYRPDNCSPLKKNWEAGKIILEARGRLTYPGIRFKDEELPGLNSLGYWDANSQQEWGLDWHRNEGIEIAFLETGSLPFALKNFEKILSANELTITRPWQPHKLGNPYIGMSRLHWFILDVEVRHPHQDWVWPHWIMLTKNDIDELTKMLRQNEQPVWKVSDEIKKCFQRIGNVLKNSTENFNESMVIVCINEILVHLLDLFRKGNIRLNETLTEAKRTIQLFINHLDKNIIEPWTVESMANYCHMGVTRFTYYFKHITNMTPMQYLNYTRVNAALPLLNRQPFQSINSICYDCGFSSPEYFATVFRKHFKTSPTSLRMSNYSG